MTAKTALILGDGGVVGHRLALRLRDSAGWTAIGISRRDRGPDGVAHLAADLLDPDAVSRHADHLRDVTHLFVAAKVAAADPAGEAGLNAQVLGNVLDVLDAKAPDLRRVILVHGTKWYGCHLGPYRVPAREDDPPCAGPLFYFDQHALVRDRSRSRTWSWCSLRPHTVWGYSSGSGNNLVTLIAVYATLLKAAGLPLSFPGSEANFRKRSQATTADLLAEAVLWAAEAPDAAGEDLNIVNGDWFRWCDLWPGIAAFFDMAPAPPDPRCGRLPLSERMKPLQAAWPALCDRHGLKVRDLDRLVSWSYGEGLFGVTWDDVSAMEKARRLGFAGEEENGPALLRILDALRRDRIVP